MWVGSWRGLRVFWGLSLGLFGRSLVFLIVLIVGDEGVGE